ncbi:MAG TPA: hypothetical protein VNS52_10045 [Gemmatimonadaceae bacterium]|nr:hypothetical protein [Gemmatimonadaceae bacterium]
MIRGIATVVALLAATLGAASACKGRDSSPAATTTVDAKTAAVTPADAAPLSLPAGPWHLVAQDARTLVAVDTSTIVTRRDGEARVRIHYGFAASQSVPGTPGIVYRTIVSQEVTECAKATSHPSSAVLYDSTGKEVGRATSPPGPPAPGLIGNAGDALCAYLRETKKVR